MFFKKTLIFLLLITLLCGCSSPKVPANDNPQEPSVQLPETLPNDNCDFLIQASWEGRDTQCTNTIYFGEDFSFGNSCACGSPVGDGDICETFCYGAKDHSIYLLDSEDNVVETGTILYADDLYLIVDLWNRCYVYENIDKERPTPHASALEYIGTESLSKPCFAILGYEDGKLTISARNYDHDAASDFEIWTLPTSEEINFSSVSVYVENDIVDIQTSILTQDEYEQIGEGYTHGYVEMNNQGKVAKVVFYGETIINQ